MGEPSQRTGKARLGKLECLSLQPAIAGGAVRGGGGRKRGKGSGREGEVGEGGGCQWRKSSLSRSSFHCSLSFPQTTRTSSGRQLLGSNPSRIKRDFFFPSRNWLWCVARPLPSSSQLLPSFFFSSFFFFLRHGPGSGSWKRNKCGKRERKSELNDRMQAT